MVSTRRKRITPSIFAPVVAGLLVAFCFNYGDYPGPDWYKQVKSWFSRNATVQPPLRWAENSTPPRAPITVTPPRPLGVDSSVSRTPQALILVATQPGRNSREGTAQIGVNALSPQTYQAGALLVNGARLSEIHDAYVLLQRDGHTARLDLLGQPTRSQANQDLLLVGGTSPIAANGVAADPLTRYFDLSPRFIGSRMRGVAVYPGLEKAPFAQLGLEPGDVLNRIDNTIITTSSQASGALRMLLQGATITAQIDRGGVIQTLELDGSKILPPAPKPKGPVPHVEGLLPPQGLQTTL